MLGVGNPCRLYPTKAYLFPSPNMTTDDISPQANAVAAQDPLEQHRAVEGQSLSLLHPGGRQSAETCRKKHFVQVYAETIYSMHVYGIEKDHRGCDSPSITGGIFVSQNYSTVLGFGSVGHAEGSTNYM